MVENITDSYMAVGDVRTTAQHPMDDEESSVGSEEWYDEHIQSVLEYWTLGDVIRTRIVTERIYEQDRIDRGNGKASYRHMNLLLPIMGFLSKSQERFYPDALHQIEHAVQHNEMSEARALYKMLEARIKRTQNTRKLDVAQFRRIGELLVDASDPSFRWRPDMVPGVTTATY